MMKSIVLEFYKLRRKYLLSMASCFLLIELLWAFSSTNAAISRHPENATWAFIIVMVSSMNCVFLPILSAICVSRICDMEHKGDTWKLFFSLSLSRGELYFAKFFASCSLLLWASIWQTGMIWAYGLWKGFGTPLYPLLFHFFLGTVLASCAIIALQQWISMVYKNQAFALTIGMAGAFLGLAGNLFPLRIQTLFIWSYYMLLIPVQQILIDGQMHLIQGTKDMAPYFAILVMIGLAIYAAGFLHFARKEVA